MASDREVDLTLTARDEASEAIEDVADSLERLPDEAEVEVEADTRTAQTRLERFAGEVEDLTDDARELRFTFRAEQLQRQIRNTLRQLERLEDPAEVEVATRDLERAQEELRGLADLAGRRYEIDIDADPRRTARRAADDLDSIRARGEGLQSVTPALRGFTDELGGAAAGAGIAAQAVADLGDTALIVSERFATGGRLQSGLARFGTALGGLAVGGVVIGGAVAGFQALQRVIGKLRDEQSEANEELVEFQELLEAQRFDAAARKLQDSYGDLIAEGERLGFNLEDIIQALLGEQDALGARPAALAAARGASTQFTQEVARARTEIALASAEYGLNTDQLAQLELALRAANDELGKDVPPAFTRADLDNILGAGDALEEAAEEADTLGEQLGDAADATEDVEAAGRRLEGQLGRLTAEETGLRLAEQFERAAEKIAEGELSAAEQRLEMIRLTQEVANYAGEVLGLPPERVSEIVAELDAGSIEDVEQALRDLEAVRRARLIVAVGYVAEATGEPINSPFIEGPRSLPGSGDIGPLPRGARGARSAARATIPTATVAATVAVPAGGPREVNVYLPRAAEARDVRRVLERFARRNGRI